MVSNIDEVKQFLLSKGIQYEKRHAKSSGGGSVRITLPKDWENYDVIVLRVPSPDVVDEYVKTVNELSALIATCPLRNNLPDSGRCDGTFEPENCEDCIVGMKISALMEKLRRLDIHIGETAKTLREDVMAHLLDTDINKKDMFDKIKSFIDSGRKV